MKINPDLKIVVFLGPSLDVITAQSILIANYFPPIKMGDIYSLLTANLETIIIIDGEFHGSTPIWQREILAALNKGITVIGTASMGALRALELAPYGMIGTGIIYDWYEQEFIEGDDEVSLLHSSAEQGYKNISEPLVNIRYTLIKAEESGLLTTQEKNHIFSDLKNTYYGHRTYNLLFKSLIFQNIPKTRQQKLTQFIQEHRIDLKRKDAINTLRNYARGNLYKTKSSISYDFKLINNLTHPLELFKRGLISSNGSIKSLGKELEIVAQKQTFIQKLLASSIRRFYLLKWSSFNQFKPPTDVLESSLNEWFACNLKENFDYFASNGITKNEVEEEMKLRTEEIWLLEKIQAPFNIDSKYYDLLANIYNSQKFSPLFTKVYETLKQEIISIFYIADWAKKNGIECPDNIFSSFREKIGSIIVNIDLTDLEKNLKKMALVEWIIAQTPAYFGLDQWSADLAVIRELQMANYFVNLSES